MANLKDAITNLGAELAMVTNALPERRVAGVWAAFRELEAAIADVSNCQQACENAETEAGYLREGLEFYAKPSSWIKDEETGLMCWVVKGEGPQLAQSRLAATATTTA